MTDSLKLKVTDSVKLKVTDSEKLKVTGDFATDLARISHISSQ